VLNTFHVVFLYSPFSKIEQINDGSVLVSSFTLELQWTLSISNSQGTKEFIRHRERSR